MSAAQPSRAILITGCSSGIAQVTAMHLAKQGHNVYATARDAVYAECHAAVAKADKEGDESSLASDPEAVAKVIERAINAGRPKTRYRVSFVVRLLPRLRGLLGGRGFDLFLRTQVPPPKP